MENRKHMPRGSKCSMDGCARNVLARGLCGAHYGRIRNGYQSNGPIQEQVRHARKTPQWFWDQTIPEPNSGCLLWVKCDDASGYGVVSWGGRNYHASHVAWFLTKGHWPSPGMVACHRCDTPACVNPEHIFIGTSADNVADKVAKKRHLYGESHTQSKLKEGDVVQIRKRIARGEIRAALAREYGVTYMTIQYIHQGITWRHVA